MALSQRPILRVKSLSHAESSFIPGLTIVVPEAVEVEDPKRLRSHYLNSQITDQIKSQAASLVPKEQSSRDAVSRNLPHPSHKLHHSPAFPFFFILRLITSIKTLGNSHQRPR